MSEADDLLLLLAIDRLVKQRYPQIIDETFAAQAAFIKDPATRKAAQCTRRAGKSNGVGRALFHEAYAYPTSSQLYLALTRDSAKNIMWDDVIKRLNTDLNLNCKFNETELSLRIPSNDSRIRLAGADASKQEMEKFLGGKYRCVIIDEAGSFRQDMRKLVYENLEPAVADWEGWIGMIGTPTEITKSLFFDICNGTEAGWSLHRWTTANNPYMATKWAKKIEFLISTNPRIVETPAFKRMYLNQWVIDTDSLVYRYEHERNAITELPKGELLYVLGVDLGFNDSSSFSLVGFKEYDRNLYVRMIQKERGMIIKQVADRIEWFQRNYPLLSIEIDGANKQAVEEMRQRYDLNLSAADKTGKADFIGIMNSDFQIGQIKVLQPDCKDLTTEYASLIWDEKKKPKKVEHPNCENHAADATLYAWRKCYNYRAQKKPIPPTEAEKVEQWFEDQAEELERKDQGEYEWDNVG